MQLRHRGPAAASLVLGIALLVAGRASLAQVPLCAGTDPTNKNAPGRTNTVDFHPYRVPNVLSAQTNRDIQFHWSDTYQSMFGVPFPTADLQSFGIGIADTYKNPFNFPMTDIQLIHDFQVLRRSFRDSVYAVWPAPNGFRVSQVSYPDPERNHIDTYLYVPRVGGFPGDIDPNFGQWTSTFTDPEEDLDTDPSGTIWHQNSIQVPGPLPAQVGVGGANAWYRPDGPISSIWNHEFQHDLNAFGNYNGEMYSSISQVITGIPPGTNPFDVPYAWGMFSNHGSPNYNAAQAIGGYMAYNFRGADTTFDGRADDLLWRWSMAAGTGFPTITSLGEQLIDSRCAECAAKFPAGVTSAKDRREVFLHNVRVYNYVDNPSIAQGQYGIPPNFGPSPSRRLGFWKDQDGCCWDNTLAIPPETTLTASTLTAVVSSTRTVSCGTETPACQGHSPTVVTGLDAYGAEYWIVRSDASLNQAGNKLVVRLEPTQIPGVSQADRLMMTVVGYSNSVDGNGARTQLWTKPDWAQSVVGPQWIDVRSQSCGTIELTLPNFGTTNKAALVVITVGGSGDSQAPEGGTLPFQLTMSVQQGSACTPPAPTALMTSPTISDMRGAFNPAGDEVVFMHFTPGTTDGRIYRKKLDGSPATQLVPGTPNGPQTTPDWSPRGDWVAYEQDTTSGDTHLWLYNTQTGENRRLTNSSQYEVYPAFSTNGQEIAYSHGFQNGIDFVWEIRRVKLDGSSNTLVYACNNRAVLWPRWSPDNSKIYFTRGDSLFAVNAGGGQPVAIPKVVPPFYSFDLPLGKGPFVTEDHFGILCTATHLALQDTTALTRVYPLEQAGKSLSHARWAYDGIRLIYGAGPQGGDNDLYVASTTCNHAPVLAANAKYDMQLFACSAYQRTITATDADGDPITYQAVNLPAGASFIQGNKFKWTPSTNQEGQSFYVVFRAIDNKGGVGQAVVRFDVLEECVVCQGPPYCLPESRQPVVDEDLPHVYMLKQNSPNPFSSETRIGFDVPQSSQVKIDVFDIQGRLVRSLANRTYGPGHWSVTWNRQDSKGYRVPLGVYFYRARMGSYVSEKKMMLLQ